MRFSAGRSVPGSRCGSDAATAPGIGGGQAILILRRHVLALLGGVVALPTAARAGRSDHGDPRLLQGPMLGVTTPDSALVWSRASGPYEVSVEYADNPAMNGAMQSTPMRAGAPDDYTVRNQLTGLTPGARYHYRMLVEGKRPKYQDKLLPFSFRTAPAEPARFRVAFGSCLRVQLDPEQVIWHAVRDTEPDLFLWLGDNIYGDALRPEILAEEYREQRNVPASQPVLRSASNLAIWDDHDYGLNDGDRTSTVKGGALATFRRYWPNPGYGLADTPGVFFAHGYGGVDFFFLDGRYHRDPNAADDTPDKTQLGVRQRQWLEQGLRASRAPFKILVSGGGWSNAKGPGGDSWAAFRHERDALFDFIRDHRIGGVVLMSGDTHVAELNAVPWSERGGYDLYDLGSSPMAQDTDTDWNDRRPERRIREVYESGPNFGLIDFDMTTPRPSLTYRVVNAYGQSVWRDFTLHADELANGVRSWDMKIDDDARAWHRRIGDVAV